MYFAHAQLSWFTITKDEIQKFRNSIKIDSPPEHWAPTQVTYHVGDFWTIKGGSTSRLCGPNTGRPRRWFTIPSLHPKRVNVSEVSKCSSTLRLFERSWVPPEHWAPSHGGNHPSLHPKRVNVSELLRAAAHCGSLKLSSSRTQGALAGKKYAGDLPSQACIYHPKLIPNVWVRYL